MDDDAENQLKARVEERARELRLNVRDVYAASGMSRDLNRTRMRHRTIESMEKLAEQLGWTFAELMGFPKRIDVGISALAYDGAVAMMPRLPSWARSRVNWIDAHATIYDLLMVCRDAGKLSEDAEGRAKIVAEYVEILARAWESRPEPVNSPAKATATTTEDWSRRCPPGNRLAAQ